MNDNYDYSIQVIGESAKELQESFFDVYFRQVGSLSYLLGQMEMLSENDKKKFSPLAQRQSDRLNRAMEQFNSLVNTLKAIDVDGKRIETLSFNIAQKMSAKTMTKKPAPVKKKELSAEVQTEPVTEAATEAVAEVQTEPVTEAATEAIAEVQTEPVTEAATEAIAEVQTEPVTEAATEAVAEVQTEPVTEAATEAVAEEPVLIPSVNPELIPVEEKTEPKELIEDTPEAANAAMFDRFKSLPGMENLKLNENGQPDFSSILPPDIKSKFKGSSLSELTSFIAKYQREQMGIAPSTEPAVQLPVIGDVEENTEATTEAATEAIAEVQTEPSTEVVEEVANQLIIPTVAPPAAPVTSPATEVVAESTVDTVITTDAINDVIIPAVDAVSDNVTGVDVSTEQVLIPAVNSEIISGAESTEVTSVIPAEVVSEPSTEAVLENNLGESGLRKFIDNTTVPRAILVSEAQFDKLGNSRVSQEALLKFKRILPDVKAGNGESAAAVDMSDLSDADKSKTIEAMMADANNLYTSGKIEEAQAMYDKISELNKSLVKE